MCSRVAQQMLIRVTGYKQHERCLSACAHVRLRELVRAHSRVCVCVCVCVRVRACV